jgi:hypothetical protein
VHRLRTRTHARTRTHTHARRERERKREAQAGRHGHRERQSMWAWEGIRQWPCASCARCAVCVLRVSVPAVLHRGKCVRATVASPRALNPNRSRSRNQLRRPTND